MPQKNRSRYVFAAPAPCANLIWFILFSNQLNRYLLSVGEGAVPRNNSRLSHISQPGLESQRPEATSELGYLALTFPCATQIQTIEATKDRKTGLVSHLVSHSKSHRLVLANRCKYVKELRDMFGHLDS